MGSGRMIFGFVHWGQHIIFMLLSTNNDIIIFTLNNVINPIFLLFAILL